MKAVCAQCRFENPAGFCFCGRCGARLLSVSSDSTAVTDETLPARVERRQVTVLFCDLVGSTQLSQQLDLEDLRSVLRTYQDACTPVIERCGGFVARYVGDGILVFFGYPRARENDAEQAVRAALGIVSAVNSIKWNTEFSIPSGLSVRIGVSTGQVVADDLVEERLIKDNDLIGETLNIASRLQTLAEPDTVLISSRTKRLVGDLFAFRSLGMQKLKGLAEPIEAWQVYTSIEKPTRFESMHATDVTSLVNRVEELQLLGESWSRSKAGQSQVVVISGEAGIGKSRITQAFRERILDDAHVYLGFQCSPYHINTALHPISAHFQQIARIEHDDSVVEKLEKLRGILRRSNVDEKRLLPVMAALLEIPNAPNEPFEQLTANAKKQATINAFYDQIIGLSRSRPVLAVVEDVHWIDPSSREVLERFIAEIDSERILMILTCRLEARDSEINFSGAKQIHLSRLSTKHSIDLIKNVAAGSYLPSQLIDQVVSKAAGVALFVEELTKALLPAGTSEQSGAVLARRLDDYSIPDSLHDLLREQLDRLGTGKRIAQIGAIIGRQFSSELLESIVDVSASELQIGLDELLASGLVSSDGCIPKTTYTFKHALVRDAAYSSLVREERCRFHHGVAQLLESRSLTTMPDLLAHHYSAAEMYPQAIDHWLRAGQAASLRSAHVEASNHFQKGLKLLRKQPSTDERGRKLLKFLINYGPTLMSIQGSGAAQTEAIYQEAIALADTLIESEDHFTAYWGWWRISRDFNISALRAEKLQQLAEKLDDDGLRLQAHHCLWATKFHLGDYARSQEHVEQGLELYADRDYRSHCARFGGHDPRVCALGEAAQTLWMTGYPDKARVSMHRARLWSEELKQTGSLAHVMDMNLLLLRYQCATDLTMDQANELVAFAEEHHFSEYKTKAEVFLGWSMVKTGEQAKGIDLMIRGISSHNQIGTPEDPPVWLEMLADAYLEMGEFQLGLDAIDEAFQQIKHSGVRFWEAEMHRRKGELLQSMSEQCIAQAVEHYETAIQISRMQGAKALELRAALSRAQCVNGVDKVASREQLKAILSQFSEGFDTPDRLEAQSIIHRLSSETNELVP